MKSKKFEAPASLYSGTEQLLQAVGIYMAESYVRFQASEKK